MFCSALKSRAEIFSVNGTILPVEPMWSNFIDVWKRAPLAQYAINSLLIAGGSTLLAMLCGIPAAYALSRMKFKGKTAFLGFVIVSQMFAPVVLVIGIYKVMAVLGFTDSIVGLIFVNAAFNQAFTIWLLRGTFMSISPEMPGKTGGIPPLTDCQGQYRPDFTPGTQACEKAGTGAIKTAPKCTRTHTEQGGCPAPYPQYQRIF